MLQLHAPRLLWKAASFFLIATLCLALGVSQASAAQADRTADIAVLYTGDVHCAADENIGYAGLAAYRDSLIDEGCDVLLVDSGDAIQGAAIGSFSEGADIIALMNEVGYCAMALGNHEFDYGGPTRLNELAELADFPFLSANFVNAETGEAVYDGYTLVERDGVTIAFVGVSTPGTLTSSTPAYFMDGNGSLLYDFLADGTGEALWRCVQDAVNAARSNGADYVFALTHLGIEASASPYTSNELIEHTTGIDAVLDGHSHSVIECARVKNADGDWVLLSSTGTQLQYIGLLLLDKDGNLSTGLVSAVSDRDADTSALIDTLKSAYEDALNTVTAHLDTSLVINDPETDVRIVRSAETNLGDLCADAYRAAGDADIAFVNGGGIRSSMDAGDVTYGQIVAVNPFGNLLCKVRVTGQTILDALEFGARFVPEESGAFLQVSGLTYEICTDIPSSVQTDDNGMFVSVDGEYRVQNVQVGGEPLEPTATYTLVSTGYTLKDSGDGYTMFSSAELLMDDFLLDADALTAYINGDYQQNAAQYADPYGKGRIVAVSGE